ncbi:MAG: HAD family hydrolase [Pirellulaceae bacterium]
MSGGIPEFLYFDLGNVLLTFDHRIACRQLAELTGLPTDRVWEIVFGSDLQARHECGSVSGREFYEEFCAASGTRPEYAAFEWANSAMFELNVPVIPIVAQVHSAGYRLGILSNTCGAHWDYVSAGRFRAIREFFAVRVLSYAERCSKPDAAIYRRAVEMAATEASRIFFVDDRPENVEGALRAGLDAVLYEGPLPLAEALRSRGMTFNY